MPSGFLVGNIIDGLLRASIALGWLAGTREIILRYYSPDGTPAELKGDHSPVTVADRQCEEFLRKRVAEIFPGDSVLGEEFGADHGVPAEHLALPSANPDAASKHGAAPGRMPSLWRWVLDPIDGTRAFCRGVPLFGTLIGIEWWDDQRGMYLPFAGLCDLPALDETVFATWDPRVEAGGPADSLAAGSRGLGQCFHGTGLIKPTGKRGGPKGGLPGPGLGMADLRKRFTSVRVCTVSQRGEREGSVVGVTATQLFAQRGAGRVLDGLARSFEDVRGWSDCYGYVLVATGRLEGMIDPAMKPWDLSALVPIVLAAGGRMSGWAGAWPVASDAGDAIAGNAWGYEQLAKVVRAG